MIAKDVCLRVLQKAVSTGADYAELFAEHSDERAISMLDSKVHNIRNSVIAGASVRVYKGLRSVMATTVDTSEAGLIRCAETAAEALGQGKAEIDIVLRERLYGDIHPIRVVPGSCTNVEKIKVLKDAYFAAKDYDGKIAQVSGNLVDIDHKILIANTEGTFAQDRQIRTRIAINAGGGQWRVPDRHLFPRPPYGHGGL